MKRGLSQGSRHPAVPTGVLRQSGNDGGGVPTPGDRMARADREGGEEGRSGEPWSLARNLSAALKRRKSLAGRLRLSWERGRLSWETPRLFGRGPVFFGRGVVFLGRPLVFLGQPPPLLDGAPSFLGAPSPQLQSACIARPRGREPKRERGTAGYAPTPPAPPGSRRSPPCASPGPGWSWPPSPGGGRARCSRGGRWPTSRDS